MKNEQIAQFILVVKRGVRSRCPKCGRGKLFQKWNVLYARCLVCGCPLQAREDETWFFMYVSTAFITGLFIIGMFLIGMFFAFPLQGILSRVVLAVLSMGIFVGTTGPRKGVAIAIDYFIDAHSEFPKHLG